MGDEVTSRSEPLLLKSFNRFMADIRIVSGRDEFLSGHSKGGKKFRGEAWFRLIIQTAITLVLLAAGLYILMSRHFDEDLKKIGSGFIGTVVGYWLA